MASSGVTTRAAPAPRASSIRAMIRPAFAGMSPTVALICASAMRTAASAPALAAATSRGEGPLHRGAELRGRAHGDDAGLLERRVLVRRRALPARDHRAGMAHALARGRGDARDVGDDGLRHVPLDVLRGALLVAAADLADHDDAGRVLVALEEREHLDEVQPAHRVPADADAGRLAEAGVGRLEDGLVSQRA